MSLSKEINSVPKLLTEAKDSILFTTNRPNVIMEHGKGMYLWDTSNKCYLDFMGGWAVTSLGHCPDVIKTALTNQSNTLINASPAYYNKPMLEFAKLLTNISCFDRVFFIKTTYKYFLL
ncbi:aminotransferase class III-fold pyridoxal phosphate-dependent enzyme [Clostridium guangxiense]|uniref:aminotransferase class III-fold pyridoxal phosphate-dependent enzyme n=1 Tax=Clostridium guangxiense TaxID=1662055 RepID=UPI001E5E7B52|nr:aminotransferase class III-fold pyridoxal phosphate-dependent enzyme [Clostridium guangxiense]MCD2347986.1 aminotransferase class III-fold pyridoxal phosphate-dependent enzyme [Clostridium guangxiense]